MDNFSTRSAGQTGVALGQLAETSRMCLRQLPAPQPPAPVAARSSPGMFIRASLPSPSMSCAWRIASSAREESASLGSAPSAARRGSSPVARRRARGEDAPPAERRCRCRASRVGDRVPPVVLEPMRVRRRARRAELHARRMPGRPSSSRSRSTAGVITPRSSATSGSGPSSRSTAWKRAAPGPRRQRAARRASGCPPARPSRRRSRGSGRSARGRRARTCGGSARSTSGSPARACALQS